MGLYLNPWAEAFLEAVILKFTSIRLDHFKHQTRNIKQ